MCLAGCRSVTRGSFGSSSSGGGCPWVSCTFGCITQLKEGRRYRHACRYYSDVETVKRFGGWKSDAVHAYLYADMAAAPNRAKEMLTSKPVLQPQQHTQAPNRVGWQSLEREQSPGTRCGGPEDPRPEDEEFGDSDDPDWRSARAKLQDLERQTGLTFVQRVRLKKQIAKGGVVEPPVFLQRFGGIPEWLAPVSAASSSQDAESAHMYPAAVTEPPFRATADEPSVLPQHFLPEQVFHSPSRRSALPHVVMADNAPRPAGMGHAQLRDWINQWGSTWAFLGLEPGSSMTDVMKAFKKKALVLHPDKVPESEKADATLRMSALGNAKEILLSPGLRILHDNLLGLGGTAPPPAPGAPPPSSSAAPPQPEPEPSSRPGRFIVFLFVGTTAGPLIEFFLVRSAGTFFFFVLQGPTARPFLGL